MTESAFQPHAVELRSVSKRFGSRVVLDNIELAVGRGEVVALLGASGSGKSTLLKIVSGIESADSGRVLLAGRDCTADPPYRRGVHTVFQNYALFPHLDVAANVAFPLKVAGRNNGECSLLVAQALDWVKLQDHARRRVGSLSGGERQRVALARALVDSPQCVLLDEPLSALDPHLRSGTLELLQSIQARLGTTFLFITHDREEALRLGHRIGILHQGRLEHIGSPEEVYRRPRTAYVASFIGKINWLRGRLFNTSVQTTLLIAGQQLPYASAKELPVGDVQVGIRPEDIRLVEQDGLPAEVISRQFLGDSVVLQLRLSDGTVICADQRGAEGDATAGEQVQIGWIADAAHIFPAEQVEASPVKGRITPWLAAPGVLYLAALFVGPAAVILAYSFCQRDLAGGVQPSFSWVAWQLATDTITLRVICRTVSLAALVTTLDLLLAYPCAATLAAMPVRRRALFVLVIGFPLVTSLLLRTYGWLNVLPLGWRGTIGGVALVLAFNYLPFMLLPLLRAYERVDATLALAALDLGATPLQTFWRVTVPLTLPGAISGAALVFIPVSGEYLIPHFIGEGKVNVAGTLVMEWFGHRHWPYAAACATWLAAIVLVPLAASLLWAKNDQASMTKHQ